MIVTDKIAVTNRDFDFHVVNGVVMVECPGGSTLWALKQMMDGKSVRSRKVDKHNYYSMDDGKSILVKSDENPCKHITVQLMSRNEFNVMFLAINDWRIYEKDSDNGGLVGTDDKVMDRW